MYEVSVWSVFDREGRLILAFSDEPGEFNFARMPPRGVAPLRIPYATLQCYDVRSEPDLLKLVMQAQTADDLVDALLAGGFNVQLGRPKVGRFARL